MDENGTRKEADLIQPTEDGLVKTSSIFPNKEIEYVQKDSYMASTWQVIVVLVIVMVLLKTFIYIKDDKRNNK